MMQLAEGLCLDLTDTLTGDIKLLSDFLERSCASVVQTETQTDNLLFTFRQRVENLIELLGQHHIFRSF